MESNIKNIKSKYKIEGFIVDDEGNEKSPLLFLKDTSQLNVLMEIVFNAGYNLMIRRI